MVRCCHHHYRVVDVPLNPFWFTITRCLPWLDACHHHQGIVVVPFNPFWFTTTNLKPLTVGCSFHPRVVLSFVLIASIHHCNQVEANRKEGKCHHRHSIRWSQYRGDDEQPELKKRIDNLNQWYV
jgi:hypothetical protein